MGSKVITNESEKILDTKEISPTKCLVPSANTAIPEQTKEVSSQPNSVSDLPSIISEPLNLVSDQQNESRDNKNASDKNPQKSSSVIKSQGSETPVEKELKREGVLKCKICSKYIKQSQLLSHRQTHAEKDAEVSEEVVKNSETTVAGEKQINKIIDKTEVDIMKDSHSISKESENN